MSQFSKEAETRLLNAVRAVTAGIEERGLSPTDSVIKVAKDLALGPPMIQLVVQACNIGRAAYQREKHATVLDKTATFPLARYEDVIAAIYPSKPETPAKAAEAVAVSDEYSRPPQYAAHREETKLRVKVAAMKLPPLVDKPPPAYPSDPDFALRKKYGAVQKAAQLVEAARLEVSRLRDQLVAVVAPLRDYFKHAEALPIGEVRYNASRLLGPLIHPFLDYVKGASKIKETRHHKQAQAVATAQPPYTWLAEGICLVQQLHAAKQVLAERTREFQEKTGAISRPSAVSSKTAGLFNDILGGAIGGTMTQALMPKPTNELVESARNSLETPDQTNELRQIRSRAMLSDFLANDEVISGHPPEAVTEAYNEIAQLAPRAATQPGLMRAMLRKRLSEGQLAPFEGEQLANIEKTLRQTETIRPVDKLGALHGRTGILD